MIYTRNAVTRVFVNISIAIPIACAVYVGFLFLQRSRPPTDIWGEQLLTQQPVHPGQVVEVQFMVVRRKSCILGVSRVMERADDRREFEIGFLTQVIDADVPTVPRFSGYRITVPAELTTGSYRLFSRYRYYCNGLDLWSPWVRRTKPISIEVVAP